MSTLHAHRHPHPRITSGTPMTMIRPDQECGAVIRQDADRNLERRAAWDAKGGLALHLWEHGEKPPLRCQRCGRASRECCMAGDPRYQAALAGRYGAEVRRKRARLAMVAEIAG